MAEKAKKNSNKRPRVVIVQPYVPAYRVTFFALLVRVLRDNGVDCLVAAAQPQNEQRQRGDQANEEWMRPFDQRSISLCGRTVGLGGARKAWAGADVVVIGHLGSSLDTYLALYDGMRGRLQVGLWGHIASYVKKGVKLDLALERWQLKRADHVFAYVPSGRRYAVENGVPPENVTTVMNTIDTTRLSEAIRGLRGESIDEFMQLHNLVPGRVLGYLGGLDASKRVDFLCRVLDIMWTTDPDIKIIVGGNGSQASLLDKAVSRGQVVMMGYVGPNDQALIGKVSKALIMPGRVGLVAVDALVLGVPVITTDWPWHAPEVEYLTEGISKFTSKNDPMSFAALIRVVLEETTRQTVSTSTNRGQAPLIDDMVENFAQGIMQLVGKSSAGSGAHWCDGL